MFYILLIILVIIAIFLAIASKQPDDFRYSRSATINAKPGDIFPHVNTAKSWENWSPWAKVDPNAIFTYEGPASGVGALTKWSGNMKVGQGSSLITESKPNEFIKMQLDFLKPMKANHTTEFTFTPQGNATIVNWAMYGKTNFMGKVMSVLMNCEKMMAKQFDQGLASLKAIAESKTS